LRLGEQHLAGGAQHRETVVDLEAIRTNTFRPRPQLIGCASMPKTAVVRVPKKRWRGGRLFSLDSEAAPQINEGRHHSRLLVTPYGLYAPNPGRAGLL
jgi:hypothetical protein